MNVTDEDAILEAVFCEFTIGGDPVYLDLCQIEACKGTRTGSCVSMRSGADFFVDEAPMVVMSSVMMVTDNSAGRALREAQASEASFAKFSDLLDRQDTDD